LNESHARYELIALFAAARDNAELRAPEKSFSAQRCVSASKPALGFRRSHTVCASEPLPQVAFRDSQEDVD